MALKPLHNKFKIKKFIVSTYQAVSGAKSLMNCSHKLKIGELKDQNFINKSPLMYSSH